MKNYILSIFHFFLICFFSLFSFYVLFFIPYKKDFICAFHVVHCRRKHSTTTLTVCHKGRLRKIVVNILNALRALKSRFSLNTWIAHKASLPIFRRGGSLVRTCYKASIMALILSLLCAKSCRTLWTGNLDRGSSTRRTLSKLLWAFVIDSDLFSANSKSRLSLGCFLNSITHSVTPSAKASIWGQK